MELVYAKLFLGGFVIDLLYVWYFQHVVARKKLKAGLLSVLLAAPALFGYIEISRDVYLALPYFFGLFCGTVAALAFTDPGRK